MKQNCAMIWKTRTVRNSEHNIGRRNVLYEFRTTAQERCKLKSYCTAFGAMKGVRTDFIGEQYMGTQETVR
jgi:hypothetical protein